MTAARPTSEPERASPRTPSAALSSGDPAERRSTACPAASPTALRRWSVAELIARAVPRPPAGGAPTDDPRRSAMSAVSASPTPVADRRAVLRRLLTVLVLAVCAVTVLLAVPDLRPVVHEVSTMNPVLVAAAIGLELASCLGFVVIFRVFFAELPKQAAREMGWIQMRSGALLPGGGTGSLAVGGWLLHLAGMPTRRHRRARAARGPRSRLPRRLPRQRHPHPRRDRSSRRGTRRGPGAIRVTTHPRSRGRARLSRDRVLAAHARRHHRVRPASPPSRPIGRSITRSPEARSPEYRLR